MGSGQAPVGLSGEGLQSAGHSKTTVRHRGDERKRGHVQGVSAKCFLSIRGEPPEMKRVCLSGIFSRGGVKFGTHSRTQN